MSDPYVHGGPATAGVNGPYTTALPGLDPSQVSNGPSDDSADAHYREINPPHPNVPEPRLDNLNGFAPGYP
jgi:hypothetical protein